MSDLAIKVENVSKAYTIWRDPAARLKHPFLDLAGELFPALRPRIDQKMQGLCTEFYALKDASFEVKKGDSVGIIGRNGSGKSTLLQIIAGTLQPTEGAVTVNGRVAALLELGSGFNPEFTGRENIYLNAAVLGLLQEEVDERYNDIITFADIGDFINQPVKNYSSGMYARLAFSVAINVDPEILIVDEALSVGDSLFQHKSMARMRKLMESGCTVIFVSHSIDAVRALCDQAIWLEHGIIKMMGEGTSVTNTYMNDIYIENNKIVYDSLKQETDINPVEILIPHKTCDNSNDTDCKDSHMVSPSEHDIIKVISKEIKNSSGFSVKEVIQGEQFSINFTIKFLKEINDISIGFVIKDQFGQELSGESIFNKLKRGIVCKSGEIHTVSFASEMLHRGGQSYSVALRINQVSKWDRSDNILLYADDVALVFDVIQDADKPMWFKFRQNFELKIEK